MSDARASTPSTDILEEFPQAAYIPWTWYVRPANPEYPCPSVHWTLGTFAIVNGLVSAFSLLVGHRKVMNFLTCGCLGKEDGGSWGLMWIASVGLQLCANAIIAAIYRSEAGYGANFAIGDLVLFYTTRPRLAWIVLALCMQFGAGSSKHGKGYWEDAAKQLAIAEVVLSLIASYYAGITAHFATVNGYYVVGRLQGPYATAAHMLYAGALFYLITLCGTILTTFLMVAAMHDREKDWINTAMIIILLGGIGVTSWLASWLFWAGYVLLAGDLYCPPNLVAQGAIWTIFSTLGMQRYSPTLSYRSC